MRPFSITADTKEGMAGTSAGSQYMREKITQTVKLHQMITPGDRVLLALSGGEDSVTLLDVLSSFRKDMDFSLLACHVHHGIRGETADRDADFAEKLAEKYKIPFFLEKVEAVTYQKEQGLSLEEAARILRYEALCRVAKEEYCQKIALAHHRDDQTETVLFHLIRGSGLRGLAGMEYVRDGFFIRPLLDCTKQEIHQYAQEHRLCFVTDETNASDDYARNAIRHRVMPALEEIRPHSIEKIAECGAYLREVDDYLRMEAGEFLKKEKKREEICQKEFAFFPEIKKEYVIRLFLEANKVPLKDLGRTHLQQIIRLFSSEVGKTRIYKESYCIEKTYEGIRFSNIKENKPDSSEGKAGRIRLRVFPYEKELKIPEKEYTKWVDCDKIKGLVSLRKRMAGDIFSTAPGTHKKLKSFLIDCKIPQADRDSVPLVADEKEVIWVIGYRLSGNYKISEETKTVLEIIYSEE